MYLLKIEKIFLSYDLKSGAEVYSSPIFGSDFKLRHEGGFTLLEILPSKFKHICDSRRDETKAARIKKYA